MQKCIASRRRCRSQLSAGFPFLVVIPGLFFFFLSLYSIIHSPPPLNLFYSLSLHTRFVSSPRYHSPLFFCHLYRSFAGPSYEYTIVHIEYRIDGNLFANTKLVYNIYRQGPASTNPILLEMLYPSSLPMSCKN